MNAEDATIDPSLISKVEYRGDQQYPSKDNSDGSKSQLFELNGEEIWQLKHLLSIGISNGSIPDTDTTQLLKLKLSDARKTTPSIRPNLDKRDYRILRDDVLLPVIDKGDLAASADTDFLVVKLNAKITMCA
ncbi:MAG: hypothetical protein M1836_006795 [Candelina mexicana]|nr:MAG: hypothetical protein M1836_006795 [Candelina mexicana]